MNKFSLLFLLVPLFQINTVSDFSVDIKLIAPFNKENIQVQVVVKNLSTTPVRILKNRKQDFKSNSTIATGNYIIELEKWMGNGYYLWEPPTAGIIPAHRAEEEYIFLQKEKSITDILTIASYSFSNGIPSPFSPGQYRIRISFNQSESGFEQINNSDWVGFTLQ